MRAVDDFALSGPLHVYDSAARAFVASGFLIYEIDPEVVAMTSKAPSVLVSDVRNAIAFQAGKSVSMVVNSAKLADDLDLMAASVRALAIPFEDIADEYASATITRDETAGCVTVLDCINLVATKAGFTKQ